MKAAFYEATGGPEMIQFGDLPVPAPQPNEVRIQVRVAAMNPVDAYIRAGLVAMPLPKPFIPGCDFAGVVETVGVNVRNFKVGDRVWGSNQGVLGRQGTFAEYLCADAAFVYHTPKNVSDEDAAANALVGITAWLGLVWKASLKSGEHCFVSGGTGGVGAMAVQMANAIGASVIASVGTPEKVKLAESLGARRTLNYKTDDLAHLSGINVWYETSPPTDFERTFNSMASGGRVIVMAGRAAKPVWPNGAFYPKNLSLHGFTMFNVAADIQAQAAEEMNHWASEGKLRAMIGARFPLAKAADAHRLQEENTIAKKGTLTGKIVIVL